MIRASCIRGWKAAGLCAAIFIANPCAYALYARNVTFLKTMPFSYCNFYGGQVQ